MKPLADVPDAHALRNSTPGTILQRQTAILPFDLPRLSDKAATQLVALLHELVEGIEYHYAAQLHRYQKRERAIRYAQRSQASSLNDPPF